MGKKALKHKPSGRAKVAVYSIVTAVFLVFLSALLMLANGYLPVLKNGKLSLQKTGMIIIAARPLDASIYINGKYKEKTAFYLLQNKLNNLLPGKYTVRIEKKGYRTWEKTFSVEPGLVSWANYVLMFADKLDIKSITPPAGKIIATSKNHDHQLFLSQENGSTVLTSMSVSGAVKRSMWPKSTSSLPAWQKTPIIESAAYSAGADKILYTLRNGDTHEYLIAEPDGNDIRLISLNSQLKISPEAVSWDPFDNAVLFVKSAGTLYRLNQSATALGTPVVEKLVSFNPDQNHLLYYVYKNSEGSSILARSSFDGSNKVTILNPIASASGYKLVHSPFNDSLAVLNRDSGELMLVIPSSSDNGNIIRLGKGYKDVILQKNNEKFLYFSDSEIIRYDLDKKKTTHLKYKGKITFANWYIDDCHYLLNGTEGLEIVEYDGDNAVKLSFNEASKVILDSGNSNLLYSVTENGQTKYYSFTSPY